MSWPWNQLGLPGPAGLPEIRHAYAEKLKTTHPEEDPEGFQRLHSAYQLASRMARQHKRASRAPESREDLPPPPESPQPRTEDFSFDELLEDAEEDPRPPHHEDEDFDFDRLLRDAQAPLPSPREEDFDFDRLFAEGEAERAEERRRRGQERHRGQQRQEEVTFRQEEDHWRNTEAILHTIETLYNARASGEEWRKFFQNPLFQQNKGSMDLIFGLEDFVSTRQLTQEAKLALFLAYSFDKGVARPALRPLYQMLLPAWREKNGEKNHERFVAILGVILGVAAPFVLVPLLDLGLIPALFISLSLVWIIWVVRKAIKTGSLERRTRGRSMSQKRERWSVLLGSVCVVALIAAMYWIRSGPEFNIKKLLPTKDPREQVCRYIEKDFGVEVGSLYNRNPTEKNSNVFYLEPDITKVFLAGPNGNRDQKNGKPGYTTNFPEMMLLWQLKQFSLEHHLAPVDSLDQGLEREETAGTFLITLPEEDGETVIDDLGVLLESLHQEKWYAALPSQCQIVMCSREMETGRIVLIRVHPATELYSAAQIRGLYEESFAHSVCAQIIRELELDWDFIREDGEHYVLTNEGMAQMKGNECVRLFGRREDGSVAMEYYVRLKERNIFCVPENFWETGNSEDQISFYRLLHWGDRGTFNLFYPWLRVN